jgi:hypothetical protein
VAEIPDKEFKSLVLRGSLNSKGSKQRDEWSKEANTRPGWESQQYGPEIQHGDLDTRNIENLKLNKSNKINSRKHRQ